jgi:hypothetical protein
MMRGAASTASGLFIRTMFLRIVLVVATAITARLGHVYAQHLVALSIWLTMSNVINSVAISDNR